MGLSHTFAGGCSPGDGVPDTAPENEPYSGCDPSSRRDTCPGDSEIDPIYNFMDYSDDACLYKWTQGQIDIMHAMLEFYRSKNKPDQSPVALTDGVLMEGFSVVFDQIKEFFINVPERKAVTCRTYTDNGHVDLTMAWQRELSLYACLLSSPETCLLEPSTGRAYLKVFGGTSIDMSIRCNLVGNAKSGGALTANVSLDITNLEPSAYVSYTLATSGLSYVNCSLTSSGDVDLYMDTVMRDFFNHADCRSLIPNTSTKSCAAGPIYVDTVYIWFLARSASANNNIVCTVVPFDATELTSGIESSPFDVAVNETVYFYLPAVWSNVTCVTNTTSNTDGGDVNLFMNWNDPFTYSCAPESPSSVELCALRGAGLAYAVVFGYSADIGITITCTAEAVTWTELKLQEASGPYNAQAEEYKYFSLPGMVRSFVNCFVNGDIGEDGDGIEFYMNWDGSTVYNCISSYLEFRTEEFCRIWSNSGTVYIVAHAKTALKGYSILCEAW